MKILLMGGAGAMASVILRDLLDSGVDSIGLADLSRDRVAKVADTYHDERIDPIQADANDVDGLVRVMGSFDAVINSTWYELNLKVMSSAIKAGIHYLDLGGLYHMTLEQLSHDESARDSGVTCVLGLGSSPGVTNLMAAHGAERMSEIHSVKVRVGGGSPSTVHRQFSPPYSFRTILDEACLPAAVLRNGKMEMVPGLSEKEEFVLPDPVGRVEGYLTLHSELATLPKSLGKGIKDMDFIVAFSPEFARAVALLVELGLASKEPVLLPGGPVVPYDLLTKLVDSLPKPATAPFDYGVRRVMISGVADGDESKLTYDCISGPHVKWGVGGRALGTGVPASLGAQWLASGRVREKGVLPPELSIDPGPFLRELGENGRGLETVVNDGSKTSPV